MIPIDDTPLCRDEKVLILAYDHGLEHGPVDFRDVPESADPARTFEAATHPAVTSVAVQKGVAEAFYPSFEDDVDLLLKLNGTSNLWMGEPDSAVNCSVEYADRLGAAPSASPSTAGRTTRSRWSRSSATPRRPPGSATCRS